MRSFLRLDEGLVSQVYIAGDVRLNDSSWIFVRVVHVRLETIDRASSAVMKGRVILVCVLFSLVLVRGRFATLTSSHLETKVRTPFSKYGRAEPTS